MEIKTRKQEQEAKARNKVARNHSKEFGLSYAGAKKICGKLKSNGDCYRSPGSGRKRKTSERSDVS